MTLDGALVSDDHLLDLLAEGRANCRADGHEIIQCAPVSYVVDEARGVHDPRGMFCQRIGVQMHGVAVRPSPLQNLKLAVERCRLTVAGALFAPYASGLSVLTPDEMQLGATVIEMGGGATAIAVFLEGALVHVRPSGNGTLVLEVDGGPRHARGDLHVGAKLSDDPDWPDLRGAQVTLLPAD